MTDKTKNDPMQAKMDGDPVDANPPDTQTLSLQPLMVGTSQACLVHIYPTGSTMGKRYVLSRTLPMIIGRGADCTIRVEETSVSRKHVKIEPTKDGYRVEDLGSLNGTFINDIQIKSQILADGDYLRAGNYIYRFLAGGNVEAEYHEEIYRLAIIDGLTEIPNKRYLVEFLGRELVRATRHQRPLSLVIFDLDRFKSINDQYGHLCGDYVLRELSHRLREVVRSDELLARYGGEEFVIVLPESTLEMATQAADRIRRIVQEHVFTFEGKERIPVTISAGVASRENDKEMTVEELIDSADKKLLQAKEGGRNRVYS